jgi:hypothetical protein
MPVLATVLTSSGGQKRELSQAEAAAVVRVRLAAPELAAYRAYQVAMLYLSRESRGLPVADLDFYVGTQPWDWDDEEHEQYDTNAEWYARGTQQLGLERVLKPILRVRLNPRRNAQADV